MKDFRAAMTAALGILATTAAHAQHADLEEVIVTANPMRLSAMDLAQSAVVLAGDDLARDVGASLGESLARQPGVTASYFGPRASRPIIRGLSGERVLMLLDGVSALDVSNLSPDHSVGIEPVLADQIEILKGPSTLLYGSGAVGGVVNVVDGRIPANRDPDGVSGAMELRGDTAADEFTAVGRLEATSGALAVHLEAYDRSTRDLDIPGYALSQPLRRALAAAGEPVDLTRGTVANSDSDTTGGAAGLAWRSERSVAGLSWSRLETDYGLPGPGEDPGEPSDIRIDQRQDRFDLRGEWTGLDGFVTDASLRAAYGDYEHAELEGAEVGTRFRQQGVDARAQFGHAPVAGWRGTVGAQYLELDLDAQGAEAYVPPSQTAAISVFLVEQRDFGRLTLDFGGRVERQDIDTERDARDYGATAASFAAGLLWSFEESVTAAIHLTRSERHPQATELYADGPHLAVRRYEIGDAALDTEVASTVDLGLRGQGTIDWRVSVFYSVFGDYIHAVPTGGEADGLPVYRYRQEDAAFHGAEAGVGFPLTVAGDDGLRGHVGIDLVRGRVDAGGDLAQMPPLRVTAGVEFDSDPLHASLDAAWYDAQDSADGVELPTDAYVMLDAELSYRWSRRAPGLLLFVKASNLLDEDARRHSSPLKDYVPLPGRSLTLGVRAEL